MFKAVSSGESGSAVSQPFAALLKLDAPLQFGLVPTKPHQASALYRTNSSMSVLGVAFGVGVAGDDRWALGSCIRR